MQKEGDSILLMGIVLASDVCVGGTLVTWVWLVGLVVVCDGVVDGGYFFVRIC